MIFPTPVSSHSSAEMMNGHHFQKLFCFTFFQKLFGLGGSGSTQ